jgi:hypothetical protein
MKNALRRRPSPAMVVASLALLVALGGTSVAAVTAVPKNSVGTSQLKANAVTNPKIANAAVSNAKLGNDSVTGSKIKNGQVVTADIADGTITSAKLASSAASMNKIAANAVDSARVLDHSLLKVDFAAGQLPAGPPGPPGTVGKLVLRRSSVGIPANNSSATTVSCNGSEQAVSGGAIWADQGDFNLTLVYSAPVYSGNKATGWTARGRNQTGKTRTFNVQVLCGKS